MEVRTESHTISASRSLQRYTDCQKMIIKFSLLLSYTVRHEAGSTVYRGHHRTTLDYDCLINSVRYYWAGRRDERRDSAAGQHSSKGYHGDRLYVVYA